jgi:hypothetical protein
MGDKRTGSGVPAVPRFNDPGSIISQIAPESQRERCSRPGKARKKINARAILDAGVDGLILGKAKRN